jgi:hypothetical protein
MSHYLVRELERYGVAIRDRSQIAQLHGQDGQLEAVTLISGERLPFSYLFLFLGALPCTDWLDQVIARDEDGFILIGPTIVARICWRRACQGSTRPAMPAPAPPNDAPRPSARERWSCSSSTRIARDGAEIRQ